VSEAAAAPRAPAVGIADGRVLSRRRVRRELTVATGFLASAIVLFLTAAALRDHFAGVLLWVFAVADLVASVAILLHVKFILLRATWMPAQ
jgi:type IV secretory pathway TrbD component